MDLVLQKKLLTLQAENTQLKEEILKLERFAKESRETTRHIKPAIESLISPQLNPVPLNEAVIPTAPHAPILTPQKHNNITTPPNILSGVGLTNLKELLSPKTEAVSSPKKEKQLSAIVRKALGIKSLAIATQARTGKGGRLARLMAGAAEGTLEKLAATQAGRILLKKINK